MFDLPILTYAEQKAYRNFRKYLIQEGFLMLQNSVYSKLVLNESSARFVIDALKKNKPQKGLVCVLKITEAQYARMEYIVGEHVSDVVDTEENVVII